MKFRTNSIFGAAPLIYDRFGLLAASGSGDQGRYRCNSDAAAPQVAFEPKVTDAARQMNV